MLDWEPKRSSAFLQKAICPARESNFLLRSIRNFFHDDRCPDHVLKDGLIPDRAMRDGAATATALHTIAYPQHVRSESTSQSEFLRLALFFAVCFLALAQIPRLVVESTFLSSETAPPPHNKSVSLTATIPNFTNRNVYAILHLRLLHNTSRPESLEHWSLTISAEYYRLNRTLTRVWDTKTTADFDWNHSFIPIHFVRFIDLESVTVMISGHCKNPWLEHAFLAWEIGSSTVFIVARALNFVMLVVMASTILLWFIHIKDRVCLLRTQLATAALVLHFLSHLPLDFVLYYRSAALISYLIQSAGFAVLFTLWALKVFGFDIEHVKHSSELRTILAGWLAAGFLAFRAITGELQLFTYPRAYDGSNPKDADFLDKNLLQIACGYAFYLLGVEIFDRLERMENDEQYAFFVDNALALFALAANAVMFFDHFKTKRLVEHPVRRMVIAILWDLVAMYEAVASAPTSPPGAPLDDFFGGELMIE
jgi:hypothetical protein